MVSQGCPSKVNGLHRDAHQGRENRLRRGAATVPRGSARTSRADGEGVLDGGERQLGGKGGRLGDRGRGEGDAGSPRAVEPQARADMKRLAGVAVARAAIAEQVVAAAGGRCRSAASPRP